MIAKILATAALATLPLAAQAQEQARTMSLGEFEYRNSCAACHGAGGAGDGTLAPYLTVAIPDLSVLEAENDGLFPLTRVYAIIEGSERVAPHGVLDMPVWGNRYRGRIGAEDLEFGPEEEQAYVVSRIMALIEHLASIQVE